MAASFIPLLDDFDFRVKIIVIITSNPVVAANVLCTYSIKNSPIGTSPAGQRGQSGHERPTPEALTYPPKKIRVNKQERVPKERYFREFIFS
jgi:flagellar basal body-associated protein FliL